MTNNPNIARPSTAWGITTGAAGQEQQVLGVLECLIESPQLIRVKPSGPEKWFAPWLIPSKPRDWSPPWPDLVVTAGRKAAGYARLISKLSGGQTFTTVLQDPRVPAKWFDLLWVNSHDKPRGENVIHSLTAPHRITETRLQQDSEILAQRISPLKGPFLGLILGGPNSVYEFSISEARSLATQTLNLAKKRGASVLVSPSRRTGQKRLEAVGEVLSGSPHWIWDEEADNPYFGILGLADELVVTCDSVNMLGEAASTGKPVHIAKLQGQGGKFSRFHQGIIDQGSARWLDEYNSPWSYTPIDTRMLVANEILGRYHVKQDRLQVQSIQ